eukprot:6346901-Amphidinium_carterae.1
MVAPQAPVACQAPVPVIQTPSSNFSLGDLMHIQMLFADVRKFVVPAPAATEEDPDNRERSPRGPMSRIFSRPGSTRL